MANLVIDIGNTSLKAAWCEGITIGKTFRYQGERMLEFILSITSESHPDILVLSNVRRFSEMDMAAVEKVCGKLVTVDSGFLSSNGFPSFLTPDRATSLIAVRHLFKGKGCIVFDIGTTFTVDLIDESGKYDKGFVSIGLRTRSKALSRYSGNMPVVDVYSENHKSSGGIKASIIDGITSGMMFEIEGYLARYPGNTVVFTGGDAIYFAKRMKNSIFVVCNLVLIGLALIALDQR